MKQNVKRPVPTTTAPVPTDEMKELFAAMEAAQNTPVCTEPMSPLEQNVQRRRIAAEKKALKPADIVVSGKQASTRRPQFTLNILTPISPLTDGIRIFFILTPYQLGQDAVQTDLRTLLSMASLDHPVQMVSGKNGLKVNLHFSGHDCRAALSISQHLHSTCIFDI